MPNNISKISTKDFLVTLESFELEYDSKTDMLVTKPIPQDLEKYYDPNNYISHSDSGNGLLEKIYQTVKKYTLNKKVKLINEYTTEEKKLLDIGCGTGEFLISAKNKNWETIGVELNDSARKKALDKKLEIYKSLDDLNNQKFDVITLWHVLEHLPDLDNQINKIASLLNKNGTLIIAVPNYKSHDAQYYKEFWAAYDTPRHLWHFSQNAIKSIFKNKKIKVVKTLPMYFDSYYVSLLSEKYKSGSSNYLKAFYRGFISNMKAKTSTEYSSLIYVLKKE
ncbi:bifunctional 2-polyprenyl-6-hydroxyphenol methylase/3-demethylubiquinol 3-O-methyltransferase UbiG [Maribacter sp. 1_MG-2023]|uniref:class I SAM-dependent methyltransferase n=1 Tax=Maribacter sp. 1_MG-2023 TaxID=3062677 RepID=UPI0026E4312B|nr:class I SAM-dependent methyltransferase [Maribacter sp. 1_MG-2023]MDO6471628.1 class I SAM-dependent methyltransferase [Maribacter sp. 1_MG-2023]